MSFPSRVVYIAPYLDKNGQVEIRFELENPNYLLKPDMYAEINIQFQSEGAYPAIPRSAVINSGAKKIVYVSKSDGSYSPRQIETGVIAAEAQETAFVPGHYRQFLG